MSVGNKTSILASVLIPIFIHYIKTNDWISSQTFLFLIVFHFFWSNLLYVLYDINYIHYTLF